MNGYLVISVGQLRKLARLAAQEAKRAKSHVGRHCIVLRGELIAIDTRNELQLCSVDAVEGAINTLEKSLGV